MRTRRAPRAAAVAGLVLTLAATARADPRWWWDDAPLSSSRVADVDVDVVPDVRTFAFFAWVEPVTPIDSWVWLTATFDGGCSTCAPVEVVGALGLEDDIALAVAEIPSPSLSQRAFSVAILQESGGFLRVVHGRLTVPSILPPAAWCDQLRSIRWEVTMLSAAGSSQPDIAAISSWGLSPASHGHAVWRQVSPTGEWDVFHARDLVGDGTAWEVTGALPRAPFGGFDVASPKVTVDLVGEDAASSVNVAWLDRSTGQVLALRSTDSGTSFSATGDPVPSEPAVVSSGPGVEGLLALDSGVSPPDTDPLWHGLVWQQDRGPLVVLAADAQRQVGPAATDPPWGPDATLDGVGASDEFGLAAAVLPGGDAGDPAPVLALWGDPSGEIAARGGRLEQGAATPVDFGLPAFSPVRPGDPAVSALELLTACAIDDPTGACVSTRPAGHALRPAVADAGGVVFLAFLDDRDGVTSPWWKRSDRRIDAVAVVPTADCSVAFPGRARLTLSFSPLLDCRSAFGADERLRRYFVYYGTGPGGPFENTDLTGADPFVPDTIVIDDDGLLADPVVVTIDDLDLATRYQVIVVPEDQARNLAPPTFDALADTAVPWPGEEEIVTPPCDVPARCLYRADSATRDTVGLFAGARDPGNDVAFAPPADVAYLCPFAPGDSDPEPVLAPGAAVLICYQVEGADVGALTVTKDTAAATVRLTY